MTSFRIEKVEFSSIELATWANVDPRFKNWPVVYTLDGHGEIYVGESLNVVSRMRQHMESPGKRHLELLRVVIDETFNKSVCLDLESYLIRLLAGDGTYLVLNRNDGITDADYFGRAQYQEIFKKIFDELFREGVFSRKIPEIENDDLFKLSPFKALSDDQALAVECIVDGLIKNIDSDVSNTQVVQGDPGTGKTIVAIYLAKLIHDLAISGFDFYSDGDSIFSRFFTEETKNLFIGFRIAIVVPQQSLRTTVQRVFSKTYGLKQDMVLSPFEVGQSDTKFDLLIVDETHRLNRRSNQSSGILNKKFIDINQKLFGFDDRSKTQLDWIIAQSTHQIFMIDPVQSIRPADLPSEDVEKLISKSKNNEQYFKLWSQMRVKGGEDYVEYIRSILNGRSPRYREFENYEFRMFEDMVAMRDEIIRKNEAEGLARILAGYAWKWESKVNRDAIDIEIDGLKMRWNSTARDWINSLNSINEVGSIHTVQGYDLNYAGVIVGPELCYDESLNRIVVRRENYFDAKGKENNKILGIKFTDDDLLTFVLNIYGVLCTRGILGTFVYICDPQLRSYMRKFV